MARRTPEGPPPPPVVQRVRLRYAKRGRLRFSSHRDFARAFERALRRAEVPMAYSGGFTPHPKISYMGAAPTGTSSEAEYLEIGLAQRVEPEQLRQAIDAALPDGLDIVAAVEAGAGSLADRLVATRWRIELSDVEVNQLTAAVAQFQGRDSLLVQRLTKAGRREVDVRGPVVSMAVRGVVGPEGRQRAILDLVVRQGSPAVRPDDVLAALRDVSGFAFDAPPFAVREEQGPLDDSGAVRDPLAADRDEREGTST